MTDCHRQSDARFHRDVGPVADGWSLLHPCNLTILFASSIASGRFHLQRDVDRGGDQRRGLVMVETVINPLIATLYPDDKTTKLNHLHAWWPGGLIAGGLWLWDWARRVSAGSLKSAAGAGNHFPDHVPRRKVPADRAAASGVSTGDMFKQMPMFLVLFASMFLTAGSATAPGLYVGGFAVPTRTVHMQGILLLVYVSAVMFIARFFAGPWSSISCRRSACFGSSPARLTGTGISLSIANSPATGILAATLCTVCFMWPTMLGTASERFPRGGALLIGLMGTAGTLSTSVVLPAMGRIFDSKKIEIAGSDAAFRAAAETSRIRCWVSQRRHLSVQWPCCPPSC